MLTPAELEMELVKESARSSRRTMGREFVLIELRLTRLCLPGDLEAISPLIRRFRERIRVSDSIAADSDRIWVLLPETGRTGGLQLASGLKRLAAEAAIGLEAEIQVYPFDDRVAANSNTVRHDTGNDPAAPHFPAESATVVSERNTQTDNVKAMLAQRPDLIVPFADPVPTPAWKRVVDIIGALLGSVLLAPLFIVTAILIKLDSRGPVFYLQLREGKDGKPFKIWKFRTMCVNAEQQQDQLQDQNEQDGPAFKITDDPRTTRIGRYLRKSCIDELPQLFNILRGEMSIVGPRPLPIRESQACNLWHRNRLKSLPGLTCIWQLDGGRDVDFDEWMRMDLEYLRRRSFWFDAKLIVRTAFLALLHRGSV